MIIDYDHYIQDVYNLVNLIKQNSYRRILGVHKGGLVVGCNVSYLLPKALIVEPIYVFTNQCYIFNKDEITENDLIVDDVIESGVTYTALKEEFPRATYAFLYAKNIKPTNCLVSRYIDTSEYIQLPYQQ